MSEKNDIKKKPAPKLLPAEDSFVAPVAPKPIAKREPPAPKTLEQGRRRDITSVGYRNAIGREHSRSADSVTRFQEVKRLVRSQQDKRRQAAWTKLDSAQDFASERRRRLESFDPSSKT